MKKNKKISYNELLHNAGKLNERMKMEYIANGKSFIYLQLKVKKEGVAAYACRLWNMNEEEFYNDMYNRSYNELRRERMRKNLSA